MGEENIRLKDNGFNWNYLFLMELIGLLFFIK